MLVFIFIFICRRFDVNFFGIWRNLLFKIFVEEIDEIMLRYVLIKMNLKFFEIYKLEVEK